MQNQRHEKVEGRLKTLMDLLASSRSWVRYSLGSKVLLRKLLNWTAFLLNVIRYWICKWWVDHVKQHLVHHKKASFPKAVRVIIADLAAESARHIVLKAVSSIHTRCDQDRLFNVLLLLLDLQARFPIILKGMESLQQIYQA